jgi:tRNA modification GTPase
MNTIVALSTPRGRGALAVVRLSGPHSLKIARHLAGEEGDPVPREATVRKLKYPKTGEILDEVLITYFEAPNSATGEDVVEISCHGSPTVVRQLIDLTLHFGAHLAGPGEFTLRALSNGKINLAQAEAIRDLISSQTEAALKQAARQLNGELSTALDPFKNRLIEVIVLLESALEFVEDDLPVAHVNSIEESLVLVKCGVEELCASYNAGRLLHDGIRIAIAGRPNVGKSSLFNKLVERDRAIVTDVPGTTRDTLSETIDIGGVPIILTDTAGLRDTAVGVETLGIERTHRAMDDADLVMVVLDGTTDGGPEELKILSRTSGRQRIVVVNKCDLELFQRVNDCNRSQGIKVSAQTGAGFDDLRSAILEVLNSKDLDSGGLLITNARHHDLLLHTQHELNSAISSLHDRRSEEIVLAPLHNALKFLGEITGETTTEDILSEIFSTFCIGK